MHGRRDHPTPRARDPECAAPRRSIASTSRILFGDGRREGSARAFREPRRPPNVVRSSAFGLKSCSGARLSGWNARRFGAGFRPSLRGLAQPNLGDSHERLTVRASFQKAGRRHTAVRTATWCAALIPRAACRRAVYRGRFGTLSSLKTTSRSARQERPCHSSPSCVSCPAQRVENVGCEASKRHRRRAGSTDRVAAQVLGIRKGQRDRASSHVGGAKRRNGHAGGELASSR